MKDYIILILGIISGCFFIEMAIKLDYLFTRSGITDITSYVIVIILIFSVFSVGILFILLSTIKFIKLIVAHINQN